MSTFRPQRKNANRHTKRGLDALESSIQSHGWIGAMTAANDGEVFDGSARLETVTTALPVDPIVIETDGTRPIVVKRTDIPTADDPRAKRLALDANRIAQLDLSWDAEVLQELLADDQSLLDGLFSKDELTELLSASTVLPSLGDGGDEFDTTTDTTQTRVQSGDLWIIGGKHRLLCGDSTNADDVARLMNGERADMMFTDPPYGVAYVGKTTDALTIQNDDLGDEGTRLLVRDILKAAHRTNRICYGMELSPIYCDVILRRAEAEGLVVEKIN